MATLQILTHLSSILEGGPGTAAAVVKPAHSYCVSGEGGSTKAETSVLSPAIPFVLLLLEMALIAKQPLFKDVTNRKSIDLCLFI